MNTKPNNKELKLNKAVIIATISALAWLPQGCRYFDKEADTAPVPVQTEKDQDIIAAKEFQQDIFKAITDNNHTLFVKNLTPELGKKYDKNIFSQYCEQFVKEKGNIEKSEYLGFLEIGLGKVFLWKMRFAKDYHALKDGKTMYKDTLFCLVTGHVDGRLRVFDFSFR